MRYRIALIVCLLLSLGIVSMTAAQDVGSIVDEAANIPELTTLVAALNASDLSETLAGAGPYTLFAPTDTAFTALLAAMNLAPETLFADTEQLRELLLYHVVAGEVASNQLLRTTTLTALDEAEITVMADRNTILLNGGIHLVRADIPARNGVIHVIDQVLLPVTPTPIPTIAPTGETAYVRVAHLSLDMPEVDIYMDGILRGAASLSAGEVSDWAALPASTYAFSFVPKGALVDEAFFGPVAVTLPASSWTTVVVLGSSAAETMQIALLDEHMAEPLETGNARVTFFNAAAGTGPLDVLIADNLALFSNVAYGEYATLDLPASDFVLHLMTTGTPEPVVAGLPEFTVEAGAHYFIGVSGVVTAPVLTVTSVSATEIEMITAGALTPTAEAANAVPPGPDMLDTLAADGRFTRLLAAIDAAGLNTRLRDAGPYTLFAPTDDAFAALPTGMLETLLGNPTALANLLLYHVVIGDVTLDSTPQAAPLTALGAPLPIDLSGPLPVINGDAQVIQPDLVTRNGRIHIVDAVLVPPT